LQGIYSGELARVVVLAAHVSLSLAL
jgi:hypothetical protein